MARFFVAATNINGGMAYMDEAAMEHIRVLRLRKGETFTVCDGSGTDYTCRLAENGPCAEIMEASPSCGEPTVKCRVFAAYSKGDKMDVTVQKCTELGADEIVVFPSHRCIVKFDKAGALKKTARWQRIAEEAAKQSGRGIIPQVTAADSFTAAVSMAVTAELPVFLYENERKTSLPSLLPPGSTVRTVSVMSGPEGGFEQSEAEYAEKAGMKSVTLGPRILRCETAPLCAVTAVMVLTGNL